MLRKIYYYASWTVMFLFAFVMVYGAIAKHGIGPIILAAVLVAAVGLRRGESR